LNLGESNLGPAESWAIIVVTSLASVVVAVFTFRARPKRVLRDNEEDAVTRVDELSGD